MTPRQTRAAIRALRLKFAHARQLRLIAKMMQEVRS